MTKEKIVAVFKAFSDESRVQILELLKGGEMCGNDILEKMKISQSTLSHHMKILCESGVVSGRKEGKWTYYSVSKDGGDEARKILESMLDVKETKAASKAPEKKTVAKKPAARKTAEKKVKPQEPAAKPEEQKKPEPKQEEKTVRKRQLESWLL